VDVFHEASKADGPDNTDLKERSAISSAVTLLLLLLTGGNLAWEQKNNKDSNSNLVVPIMK
jgi:hypothetical protein